MFKSRQNKKQKLVSIIVPAYNCAKSISKTLDSLLAQTYKNIEIVCINDGSKDSTFSILYDYKKSDKRVKIYNNKQNMGIAYTRNRGVELAHGDYIMWCDADDWYEKNMVEEMVIPMEMDYIDFAMCETNVVHDENLTERLLLENFKFIIQIPDNELQYVSYKTFLEMSCVLWNKIFRKSIIDKYKIRCANTKYAEDENFLLKYLSMSKHYYCVHEKLYNYLRNESGITGGRLAKKSSDTLSAIEDVEDFIHKYKIKDYYNIAENISNNKKEYYATLLDKSMNLEVLGLNSLVKNIETSLPKDFHIFYAVDNSCIEPFIVSITSIVNNANNNEVLHFHIIYRELDNIKILKNELSFKKHTVEFIQLSKKQISRLGDFKNDISTYKYFIPEIANELDKCLYLDCDTVVLSSLYELYKTKLLKSYMAVVESAIDSEKKSEKVNLLNIPNYFDCGVILMNLKLIREDDLANKWIVARKNIYKYLENPDCDVVNLIVNNIFTMLKPQYNLQTEIFENPKPFWCYTTDEKEFAKNNPVIIHYSGKNKPWNSVSSHLWKDIYFKYLKLAPKKHLCYWKNV